VPRKKSTQQKVVKPAELYNLLKEGKEHFAYVLWGDELYSHFVSISHIVKHFKKKGYESQTVFADELNEAEISGGGLFFSGLVYVVKGVGGKLKDRVQKFVEHMAGVEGLVFVIDMEPSEKKALSLAVPHLVVDCSKMSLREAKKILKALIERVGKKVTAGALDLMLSSTGGYIYPILTELEKLRLMDVKVVNENVVREYFALPWEPNIFVFWDSLWSGDASYVKKFKEASVLSGNPPTVLMATMASFLRTAMEVGMLLDEGMDIKTIAKEVGRSPFYVSKLAKLYRKVGRCNISRLMWMLYDLDLQVKSGVISDIEALDHFVARVIALGRGG